MGKRNYNQMSTRQVKQRPDPVQTDVPSFNETVEAPVVVETPVQEAPKPLLGYVANCEKLNVRKKPSLTAEVVCVIADHTDVEIDKEESTDEFYKVSLASGVEGFCMKKYIAVKA